MMPLSTIRNADIWFVITYLPDQCFVMDSFDTDSYPATSLSDSIKTCSAISMRLWEGETGQSSSIELQQP